MLNIKIIDVLIFFSILLAIVFFVWYLLGDSPVMEQIVLTFILPVYLFGFGIYKHLNDRMIIIGERVARIEGKLNNLGGKI